MDNFIQKISTHKIPNLSEYKVDGYKELAFYYEKALKYVAELDDEQIKHKKAFLEDLSLWYSPCTDKTLNEDYEYMALKDIINIRLFYNEHRKDSNNQSESWPKVICVGALFDAIKKYFLWYGEDENWNHFLYQYANETFDPNLHELQTQNDALFRLISLLNLK